MMTAIRAFLQVRFFPSARPLALLLFALGCAEAPTSPQLTGIFALAVIDGPVPPERLQYGLFPVLAETLVVRSRTDISRTILREFPAASPDVAPVRRVDVERLQLHRWRHLDYLGCYILNLPPDKEIDCDGGERIVGSRDAYYIGEPPAVRVLRRVAP